MTESFSRPKIIKLFETAINKRNNLYSSTNALRLINGLGDGLSGLTVDRYNRHFVIQFFQAECADLFEPIRDFIVTKFDPEYLILKYRTQADGRSLDPSFKGIRKVYPLGLDIPRAEVIINKSGSKTIVKENGIHFIVDLNDTVNTGLFLDMRKNRKVVASVCRNKSVLNCFAYSCSFGVYCRIYGALRVANIDISRKNLDRGKENYMLNNISFQDNEFIRQECQKYLQRTVQKRIFFDLIILDPPSFSRYEGKVFSLKKDLIKLVGLALRALNPGGDLFLSSNWTGVSGGMLIDYVKKATLTIGFLPQRIIPLGQDVDFPGSGSMKESYLAAVLVEFR